MEKQIEGRIELSDIIDYAMRDWDDYIDECREEEIPPIDTFEEYIADYVLDAGYRKQSEVAREIFEEIDALFERFYNDPSYSSGELGYDIAVLNRKYTEGET